ncbi:hypothetical protein GF322_02525 [Candidatus Dependentiae bacterium]|nr:hypothetical protein [Candidatus Dependentiae bacterium]
MKIKFFFINSILFIGLFCFNSVFAEDQINIKDEFQDVKEIKLNDNLQKIESFELLLEKYFNANIIKKESLARKIVRIVTREVGLLVWSGLFILIVAFLCSLNRSVENKSEINIKNVLERLYSALKKVPEVIIREPEAGVVFSFVSYFLVRSSYAFAQSGSNDQSALSLNLLTDIAKLWRNYKEHIPSEFHKTFETLHQQYLKKKKLMITEQEAQKVLRNVMKFYINDVKKKLSIVS